MAKKGSKVTAITINAVIDGILFFIWLVFLFIVYYRFMVNAPRVIITIQKSTS